MNPDNIAKAQAFLKQIAQHGKRWGKHGTVKDFSQIEMMESLIALDEAGLFEAGALTTRDELTKARRELGAARARLAKYEKQQAETVVNLGGANGGDFAGGNGLGGT